MIAYNGAVAVAPAAPSISINPPTTIVPGKRPLMIAGTTKLEPPAPAGDVKRFLLACQARVHGEQVSLSAVYARYCRCCDEQQPKASALSAVAFAEDFKAISARVALRTRQNGAKVYCLDVRLVA